MIAYERGNKEIRADIADATSWSVPIIVPAGALAQVWRGGPRSAVLARLIDGCEVDSLDEERAKEVGVRLGERDSKDVTDAHVVCCALERQAAIATSDPEDLAALTSSDERLALIPL